MDQLLKKTELASFLGISINTLNLWVCRGKIPYVKLGKSRNSGVRFSKEEITNWLRDMRGESQK